MTVQTPGDIEKRLREAYLKYYDTAFWLSDDQIRNERSNLLRSEGRIFTDVRLEAILSYENAISVAEATENSPLDDDIKDLLPKLIFSDESADRQKKLRKHQAEALNTSISSPVFRISMRSYLELLLTISKLKLACSFRKLYD